MNAQRWTVGSMLAAWPVIGTAYRLSWTADEVLPLARRGIRLIRAEAQLARESVPLALYSALAALLGFWVLLAALVAGSVIALHDADWPLAGAIGLPAGIGLLLLIGGALLVWRGVERLTFVETRARVKAMLEVLDDDD